MGDWLEMMELNGLSVVKVIRGRENDWVTWKDGSKTPFYFFYEVMEHSTLPPIMSHTAVFSICQHARCMMDIVITAHDRQTAGERFFPAGMRVGHLGIR